jgi:RsiW-degrading membrane proteinase PrsW (M82 family)
MSERRTQSHRLARLRPASRPERRVLAVLSLIIAAGMAVVALSCGGLNFLAAALSRPWLTLWSGMLAFGLGVPYFAVILWVDRNEPEPPGLILASLAWGGVMATGVSLLFNSLFGAIAVGVLDDPASAEQLTASLSAPFVEEISKGFALIVLYAFFRRDIDTLLDGLVYGALVGLGFAVVENWLYYVNSGTAGGAFGLAILRGVITGAGTHICFTALTGAGVGMFRVLRSGLWRWALPPLGLAAAMVAHFAWNTFAGMLVQAFFQNGLMQLFFGFPLAVLILQVPFLCAVAVMVWLASSHEQRIVAAYLADEVAPVVRDGELPVLLKGPRRTLYLLSVLSRQGVAAWWRQRRRFASLVRLAFEKWHMDQEAELASHDARDHALLVVSLRKRLAEP